MSVPPLSTAGYSFDEGWGGEWFDPAILHPPEYDMTDGDNCTCSDVPCSCDNPTQTQEDK